LALLTYQLDKVELIGCFYRTSTRGATDAASLEKTA
jgi:hypothetical protein